ncbi:MAG: glycosyltransferase family 1 protein [Caldilineaceae bacterium SB0668_bin_21]|nr:glycosyltransferase family 1 protein [Caldilineaceae bacterium SB0668_bin_21]MYC22109.1 glycosyltransferase family 1 protein [Caldilineaceae bacterium SB0662_bin_25]
MRFLCVSAQLAGHLDWGGYLPTAVELMQAGHDVLWATGRELQSHLTAQGVPVHILHETGWRWPPPPPIPKGTASEEEFQRLRMIRSLDQWLDVARVRAATLELVEVAKRFRPDLIVSEMFTAAAAIAAELLGVPFAVAGWPAMQTQSPGPNADAPGAVEKLAQARVGELLADFGATGVNWALDGPAALRSPSLHLTYWSPRWYAGARLLPQTRMVGGVAPPPLPRESPWLDQLPSSRPWIFITLGTAFTRDVNFFLIAARAAAEVGGVPILAVGKGIAEVGTEGGWTTREVEALRTGLPQSSVLVDRIRFAEVLPHIGAAIHHGGAGTTHALVTHGIPQIVVPKAADQARQASGVARSGVGYHIPPNLLTVPLAAEALQKILADDAPARLNAEALQEEFVSLGGIPKAAQILVAAAE